MGNTASQQNNPNQNHNALRRFSSPRTTTNTRSSPINRGAATPSSVSSSYSKRSSLGGRDIEGTRDSKESRRKEREREREEGSGKHYVHRSLRTKKKSLELPDLAPLSLNPYQPTAGANGRNSSFAKSPSIPIPGHYQHQQPKSKLSITAVDFYQPQSESHHPAAKSSQNNSSRQTPAQPVGIPASQRHTQSTPQQHHQQQRGRDQGRGVQPPYPSPASLQANFPSSITPTSTAPTPYGSTRTSRESSPGRDPSLVGTPSVDEDAHAGDVTVTPGFNEADDDDDGVVVGKVVESSQFNPLIIRSSIPLVVAPKLEMMGDGVEVPTVITLPLPIVPMPVPIPIDIEVPLVGGEPEAEPRSSSEEEIMVKISWHGGGNDVFLARQGDEKYMNKMRMEREGSTNTFTTSLPLAAGTHHIRFFVDEQWRVADDLPATVDDLGGLANYVAVGPGFADKTGTTSPQLTSASTSTTTSTSPSVILSPPTTNVPATPKVGAHSQGQTPPSSNQNSRPKMSHGHSFWDQPDDDTDDDEPNPRSQPQPYRVHSTHPPRAAKGVVNGGGGAGVTPIVGAKMTISAYEPKWTNEIPLELIEAAALEEAFLAHQEAQQANYYSQRRNTSRTHQIHGFMPLPNIPPAPRLPRILEKLILNQQTSARTTAAPAGGSAPLAGASLASPGGMASIAGRIGGIPTGNREREGREGRERERVRSPVRNSVEKRRERERDKRSLGMTPTATPTVTPGEEKKELDVELKVTTASGTDVSAQRAEREKTITSPRERERERDRDRDRQWEREREGRPMSPPSRGDRERDSITSRHPHVVDNRTIADDSSVLPVPSHVVIHHLCTSAIKNGVLGVGATTRYKKKYMSSVYYKPT